MQRVGLFIPSPPEHNAHVINSVSLFSSLTELYPDKEFIWITMNPRIEAEEINPQNYLADYGLEEFASICNVPVRNCAHLVKDEFHPQTDEIEEFILSLGCSALYMHFYPPFWETVRDICDRNQIFFGLHVKIFYRKSGLPFYFEHDERALHAIQNIDFLSVSQEQDRVVLNEAFNIPMEKMVVLPKSVPQQILKQARAGQISAEIKALVPHLTQAREQDIPLQLGYIGRFEEIKNITWFLRNCLPQLGDLSEQFHLTLVGTGSLINEVRDLIAPYDNVTLISQVLGYQDTLALLSYFDRVIYPSGFDFSPRLPLESLLMGKRCILTDVHFNHRYRPYGLMVPSYQDQESFIEYNQATICFALPDIDSMVASLRSAILTSDQDFTVPAQLEEESNPKFVAHRLINYIESRI